LAVGNANGVKVDACEFLGHQEQQFSLGQLVHLTGELEAIEDVPYLG
jgi:hypothetical protein